METQLNTMPKPLPRVGLDRNQIKYILIIAMLIDHIAELFIPTWSVLGQIMHIIGRLTGPAMSVLLAEGYQYTKDRKKYALRLFIFAVISWIPFSLAFFDTITYFHYGMIYTLFIAFITIWMWDKLKAPKPLKIFFVVLLTLLSAFGDWPIVAVLWAFFAFVFRDRPKAKWISFIILALIESSALLPLSKVWYAELYQFAAMLVPLLLIYCYNGKKGSSSSVHKWFFYIFYPAHLLLLWGLSKIIL